MDPVAKQISRDIDSGKYFSEAREWYSQIFLKPAFETAIMYFYVMCASVILCIVAVNLYSIFPTSKKITVVAKLDNTLSYYPVIKRVNGNYEQNIAEFIASRYVKARESFVPDRFPLNYKFVYRNSSPQIFNTYQEAVSTNNPNSPLITYGWNGKITVQITKVMHNGNNKVTVLFTRKGLDNYNRVLFAQNLEAMIDYVQGKIDFDVKKSSPIDFKVRSYVVKEIKA